MKPRVVLVVEDNPIARKLVRLTLGNENLTVIEASDGVGALALASKTPPDLILQDLLLPDMDGFELLNRAADLTRQLLMFSRQQVIEPKVLDLNDVLAGLDKMLHRIVGEDVQSTSLSGPSLGRVRVDPSSIEQVIMNLVVNARDAMPTGGKLTIETANVVLDEPYALTHMPAKAGPYVMIAVSDIGDNVEYARVA